MAAQLVESSPRLQSVMGSNAAFPPKAALLFPLLHVVDLFVVPLPFYLVVDMWCHVCLSVCLPVCRYCIPVFPTVTAVITLERYEEVQTETSKFLVPRD